MIRKEYLIVFVIFLIPICLYANAGAINKALDVAADLIKHGYKVFVNREQFDNQVTSNFINRREDWTGGILSLKKQSIETAMNTTVNEVSNVAKNKVNAVLQYTFTEKETKNIASKNILVKKKIAPKKKRERAKQNKVFPVQIKASPETAKIRIMNIAPAYYDGIELKAGRYNLEVTASGYRTQRLWVDFDLNYNKLEVNLNRKGSLKCEDIQVTEGGSMWQEYGTQVQIVDYLDNVTVAEVYFSQLDFVASRNYIDFYDSDIAGDFAYFNYIYGFLNKDEIYNNKNVETKKNRYNQVHIGIENVPGENKVKLITFVEAPQYAVIHSVKEAYCKALEEI